MAKKRKKVKAKASMDSSFPGQGSPMDVQNHPLNNLPDPSGGAFAGAGLNPMMGGMQ